MLGPEVMNADPSTEYLGNFFVKNDIDNLLEQYRELVEKSGREGIDILMSG